MSPAVGCKQQQLRHPKQTQSARSLYPSKAAKNSSSSSYLSKMRTRYHPSTSIYYCVLLSRGVPPQINTVLIQAVAKGRRINQARHKRDGQPKPKA
eukprot:TRINITY_DN3145_c0_g1_i1.p1 TRINITY_DN3145_c0_g1~~TRINITY_DN3145_c0_g1_i1.p1  ORF type:complete len:107 (+),score=28.05 TRINITY_DN3145_c0_g1_i1:36-323(+)